MPIEKIPREIVRQIECPECGAPAGRLCFGVGQVPRVANHRQRVQAFVNACEEDRRRLPGRQFQAEQQVPRQRRTALPDGVQAATAEETLTVQCPECPALAGQPCLGRVRADGTRHPLASHHSQRWRAAMQALGRPVIDLPRC